MAHNIVIVDDHLLIAKAISSMINQFKGYNVLYEVENGQELINKFLLEKNIPDIVLLDISMPVMDGFETATWLKNNHPVVKVIVLTMQGDDASLVKMIRAGAISYLNKNVHPSELQKALDAVCEKGIYYPDWATSRILYALAHNEDEHTVKLSEKEIEFLRYSCSEMTYSEIGEKMFCSGRTVESYRDSLFEKLHVKTRTALALFAVKIGLHKL
jgi:DNA-binding NarL/FixJ family response regulator